MGPETPLGSTFLKNIKSLTFNKKRGYSVMFDQNTFYELFNDLFGKQC